MRHIKILNLILSGLAVLMLSACHDIVDIPDGEDFSSDGVPTITKISFIDQPDSAITTGEMGQWLAIQGDNLAQVKALLFNDISVDLKNLYAVRHQISVAIPAEAPNKLTNTVTIQTDKGEITYPFTILFPDIIVNGFVNEFATAGDEAVITGRFFDLYGLSGLEATVTLNGTPVTLTDKSDTRLAFKVPDNITDNTEVVLNSPKMKKPDTLFFHNRGIPFFESYDKSYLFDKGFLWTDQSYVSDGTNTGNPVSPLGGSFFRRKNSYSAWNWDTLIGGHFDLTDTDVADHTENYNLKFEVWTAKANPLSTGDFVFWSRQSDDKMKLRWDPVSNGASFNTNGAWQTITLDAKTFFQDNEGKKTLHVGSNDITIVYQPHNDLDADFAFVNFRFVKK